MPTFEYDPNKSETNLAKHGIDFDVVQQLWLDLNLLMICVQTEPEARFLVIGKINDKYWPAIYTH